MKTLKLQKVCKSFGEKTVLRDFCLEVLPAETVVLMGRSGCGKTTLLHLIAGLILPDSGVIEGVPETLSMVFQEDRLCEWQTVGWNLRLVCGCKGEELRAHLRELGLEGELDTPVSQLSGGMKRRVAIARAVLHGGDLILDEAFRGLDGETLRQTAAYVLRHKGTRRILCATHNETVAELLGGRLIRME